MMIILTTLVGTLSVYFSSVSILSAPDKPAEIFRGGFERWSEPDDPNIYPYMIDEYREDLMKRINDALSIRDLRLSRRGGKHRAD